MPSAKASHWLISPSSAGLSRGYQVPDGSYFDGEIDQDRLRIAQHQPVIVDAPAVGRAD